MTRHAFRKILLLIIAAIGLIGGLLLGVAAPVFEPDQQPIGYVGQLAVTNIDVTSGKEFAFSIDYHADDWRGNLHKYAIADTGAISDKDAWPGGAAAAIDAQDYDKERLIVTMQAHQKIPFRWSQLSPAQQTALDPVTAAQVGAVSSPILNFIRGDRSNELPAALGLRRRSTVIGDIIHSTPIYCPTSLCAADTVFVGANDGMLHAIDAHTGKERFAYIPSMLIPKLSALTTPPYSHRYFVDGRMDLRKISGRTILVGALGAGGKGLYALDVTHAAPATETTAAANLLWEISHETVGFENLGYTVGQPSLVKLKDGSTTLIVANGYHNASSDHAVLYMIHPLTGEKIREIDTFDFGGTGNAAHPNGLSSPSLWASQRDGKIDTAYAGDLDGNLWRFDLLNGTAKKLHATQPAQAITTAPALMKHPFGGAMVLFATGRMLVPNDATDRTPHYAYGIWDGAPSGNTSLLEQALTEATYTGITPDVRVRWASSHWPDWRSGHHKGWRTPLPISGERVVGDGVFVSQGVFQFISSNPSINANNKSSSAASHGENWWMQLNALTGGDVGRILFDLNDDRLLTAADQILADKTSRLPVGRHLGGGTRSQMLPLVTNKMTIHHTNHDINPPLIVWPPPTPLVGQSGAATPSPSVTPRPVRPRGIAPGGAVTGNAPTPTGEMTPAEPLGRMSWQEIQP